MTGNPNIVVPYDIDIRQLGVEGVFSADEVEASRRSPATAFQISELGSIVGEYHAGLTEDDFMATGQFQLRAEDDNRIMGVLYPGIMLSKIWRKTDVEDVGLFGTGKRLIEVADSLYVFPDTSNATLGATISRHYSSRINGRRGHNVKTANDKLPASSDYLDFCINALRQAEPVLHPVDEAVEA